MQSFIRISSLIKILFLEFVGAAALASIVASLYKHFGGFGCIGSYNEIDVSFFVALLLGLFILGWIFLRSFYPKMIQEEFRPILKLGLGKAHHRGPLKPLFAKHSFFILRNHYTTDPFF
jgi:hypothetical protein